MKNILLLLSAVSLLKLIHCGTHQVGSSYVKKDGHEYHLSHVVPSYGYSGHHENIHVTQHISHPQPQHEEINFHPSVEKKHHDKYFVPVIKDGVPLDTPEVQAAKHAHFVAYAKALELAKKYPEKKYYKKYNGYQTSEPEYESQIEDSAHRGHSPYGDY